MVWTIHFAIVPLLTGEPLEARAKETRNWVHFLIALFCFLNVAHDGSSDDQCVKSSLSSRFWLLENKLVAPRG